MPSEEQTDGDDQLTDRDLQRRKRATVPTALESAFATSGAAVPKVVKPLPAVFSSKHFSLCSATETSEAGSLSESGYAEPSALGHPEPSSPEMALG
ncbi:hypothetical protein QOT17_007725 [Balamuthia mandrillaris]